MNLIINPALYAVMLLSILFACSTTAPAATQKPGPQSIPETVLYICKNGPDVKPNWGRNAAHSMIQEGWKNVENKNGEKAAQFFISALLIGPERPDAYWGLGVASHVAGYSLETINTCFDMAIEKIPNVSNLYTDYGRALLERGQLDEAIVTLQKALELNSDNILAHAWIGQAYTKLGYDEKAQYHLEMAEKLAKSAQK